MAEIFWSVMAVVYVVAVARILEKAGLSRWYVLLALIPLVNAVMLLEFAFREWPIERELRALRGAPPGD